MTHVFHVACAVLAIVAFALFAAKAIPHTQEACLLSIGIIGTLLAPIIMLGSNPKRHLA